jgi:hypothetical protein
MPKQEGKNIRLSLYVRNNLKSLGAPNDCIVAMYWGENAGQLFNIKYANGVGVASNVSDLSLPFNPSMIPNFNNTVLALFKYR